MNANKFFSVPYYILDDYRMKLLIRKHGFAGFGRWVALLAKLYGDGGLIDLTEPGRAEILADDLGFASVEELESFVDDLSEIGHPKYGCKTSGKLVDNSLWKTFRHIVNEGVVNEIETKTNLKEAKSAAGKASAEARKNATKKRTSKRTENAG